MSKKIEYENCVILPHPHPVGKGVGEVRVKSCMGSPMIGNL
jgi:hypothetical protein